jgi:hypothetical protein
MIHSSSPLHQDDTMIQSNAGMRHARVKRPPVQGIVADPSGEATWHAWLKVLSLSAPRNPAPRGSWMFRTLSHRPPLSERLPAA